MVRLPGRNASRQRRRVASQKQVTVGKGLPPSQAQLSPTESVRRFRRREGVFGKGFGRRDRGAGRCVSLSELIAKVN